MKKTFMMPVVCSLLAASMMLSGCSAVSNGDNAVGETSKPTEIKSIGLMVQDMSNPPWIGRRKFRRRRLALR